MNFGTCHNTFNRIFKIEKGPFEYRRVLLISTQLVAFSITRQTWGWGNVAQKKTVCLACVRPGLAACHGTRGGGRTMDRTCKRILEGDKDNPTTHLVYQVSNLINRYQVMETGEPESQ